MEIKLEGNVVKIILKVLELICVIAAICLYQVHRIPITDTLGSTLFSNGTLLMAIVMTPLLLVFTLLGQKEGNLFEAIVNFILGIFLIATGSIAIDLWTKLGILPNVAPLKPYGMGMGSMSIIGGFIYLGDCGYSFLKYKSVE